MARDPHGCAPEKADVVLLLVDVINLFDFPRASRLLHFALPAARRLRALKERLKKKSVPAIYVNDNFGRWRSDFKKQVQDCIKSRSAGAEIASLLLPEEDDYFVLKPKHSGFFSTALDVLLRYLGAKRLIIAGFAADICVLFTANDAHMRDFDVIIPSDCVASESTEAKRRACQFMKRFAAAKICVSDRIRL